MSTTRRIRCWWVVGLAALTLCAVATPMLAGQRAGPGKDLKENAAAFKQFSVRVAAYVTLQKTVESRLPALNQTDLPEMITAHQEALARRIREARPRAKPGDIFTSAVSDAFRRASRAALPSPQSDKSRAYMRPGAPNPGMRLAVNSVYPDTEPITALPPALLAAFPTLPGEVVYRVVGRTLILVDVKSRLVVDVARFVLPPE